jgi:hypothetical protein
MRNYAIGGYFGVINGEAITMEQAKEMKKIEYPAPCSFTVKSHDEKEIVDWQCSTRKIA